MVYIQVYTAYSILSDVSGMCAGCETLEHRDGFSQIIINEAEICTYLVHVNR